jgi:FSR family fosmidomycin resistance protein-like MFS transporter
VKPSSEYDSVSVEPHSSSLEHDLEAMPNSGTPQKAVLGILAALSIAHLLNDTMQSLIPAIYPVLKHSFQLTFTQIGLITLANQLTASLLQPLVGWYTDRKPLPYSLPIGMGFTLIGLGLLSAAWNFEVILVSVALVGVGSLFQVGGNAGTSIGPLLAALIIVPGGQAEIKWFSLIALVGIILLYQVGHWYVKNTHLLKVKSHSHAHVLKLSPRQVSMSIGLLMALVFSKYVYLASMTSYYTFFLIHKFNVSVQMSQVYLFVFLFAVAAGTIIGGPVGDRFGRKNVIWVSILGITPFTLLLPHVSLEWVIVLSIVIGVIMASAFSAIVVFAQELVPGKVGMIAGLFFGLAFGLAGIGSAVLGKLIDMTNISFVFEVCSFLPLLGLLTMFLPDLERPRK